MKKFLPFLVSSVLLVGVVGCETAKTNTEAPNSPNETAQAPTAETAQQTKNDATSEMRRRQLNSDIRAREQRNNTAGGDAQRDDDDLESEVRSKLEANIPAGQLAVDAEDGAVTVSGTVSNQAQLQKIEPLAKQIKGVKSVKNQAKIAQATKQ